MSIDIEKIDDAIQAIDINTELFYQNKIDDGYKNLDSTLGKISFVIEDIIRYQEQSGQDVQAKRFVEILTEAMRALENKDALLLADILQYDLKELLEEVKEELI